LAALEGREREKKKMKKKKKDVQGKGSKRNILVKGIGKRYKGERT
jgi:hypothetical protein